MKLTSTSYTDYTDPFVGMPSAELGLAYDFTLISPNSAGQYLIVPGDIGAADNSGKGRLLPREYVTNTPVSAGVSTTITVNRAQVFIPGDEVRIIAPSAEIRLTNAWAEGDTLTVTIGGVSTTYALVAGDTTTAIAVGSAADAFNADPSLSRMVEFIASGDSLFIYSKDFLTPYSIAEAVTTAGDGDAAVQDSLVNLLPNKLIGTIDTNGVNTTTNVLTLDSSAVFDVPVGFPIGDPAVKVDGNKVGINRAAADVGSPRDLDTLAIYTAGVAERSRLPYWDGELTKQLPKITFQGGLS